MMMMIIIIIIIIIIIYHYDYYHYPSHHPRHLLGLKSPNGRVKIFGSISARHFGDTTRWVGCLPSLMGGEYSHVS